MRWLSILIAGLGAILWSASVLAVDIEAVTVGNAGNAGKLSGAGAGGYGEDRVCGAVPYAYQMGTYEVTAGQYCEFLNAVAKTDIYGLYHESMWQDPEGCKIQQSSSSGHYIYSVAPEWSNRPVNYVTWGDAARFCNWLSNGQPTDSQGLSTTEDGSYYLNGETAVDRLMMVTRKTAVGFVIPTEDEWYKAAYHKNDGVTGNYWDYPTRSEVVPTNTLVNPDEGNNANFYQDGYTIGSPYWRTEVGAFENSESPYGTYDQGGNVEEWCEAVMYGTHHVLRGGFYYHSDTDDLHAASRAITLHEDEGTAFIGFRVAYIPEPASFGLLALSILLVARTRNGAV